jgi:6-phosphogluconate dehydrogenase
MGLAVMGQNLALNIAEKGFPISVWNRSGSKVEDTVRKAKEQKLDSRLTGYTDMGKFVASIQKPRAVILLIQAGKPVDEAIGSLTKLLEAGDIIVDGGNEWYQNTERRSKDAAAKGLLYMGMGVSGGEEGARHGPSLMPGGPAEAYKYLEPILLKVAATSNSGPCVTHIGPGGAGNYVKMIHNGIEYGDMQLIAEAYDLLKSVGGLTNEELHATFTRWNKTELESFLIEITAIIFAKKDPEGGHVVDKIVDKTGSKGTGKWTVQEAAEQGVPAPTMSSALDARYLSSLLEERIAASKVLKGPSATDAKALDANAKTQLISEVERALYAAKICSYAQGMNLIRTAGVANKWPLDLGEIARIWKGGCIIRAVFLDRIKQAYARNPKLANLLVDEDFSKELNSRQAALRTVVSTAISHGIATPSFSASLAYYDSYRRARHPANLTQAQRDLFGAHGYQRLDKKPTPPEDSFHTEWLK